MRSPACRARGTTCWKVGRPQRWRPGGNSFVSPRVSRRSEDSFKQYFSEMPWLAVPYTDEARRSRLNRLYGIQGRRSPLGGLPGALLARALRLSGSPSRGKSVFISMNVPILQHLRTMRWISRYVDHTSLKPFFFFLKSLSGGDSSVPPPSLVGARVERRHPNGLAKARSQGSSCQADPRVAFGSVTQAL